MDRSLIPELRSRGYDAERIVMAVNEAHRVCQTLVPLFGIAPVPEKTKLFLLNGNIYLATRGKSIPLHIWLHKSFPKISPLAIVIKPPKTFINPGSIVDTMGLVSHGYLDNWTQKDSSLGDFIQILASEFSENLPFFSLENFNLPSKAHSNINGLLMLFPNFRLDLKRLDEGSGPSEEMIVASGRANSTQQGVTRVQYVDMWLHKYFPQNAPLVYMYPLARRGIRPGSPEYRRARVDLPYLHDWHHEESCLQVLVNILSIDYSEDQPRPRPQPERGTAVQPSSEPRATAQQNAAKKTLPPWFMPKTETEPDPVSLAPTSQADTDSRRATRPREPLPTESKVLPRKSTVVRSQTTVSKPKGSGHIDKSGDHEISSSSSTTLDDVSNELRAFALEFELSDHTLQRLVDNGFRTLGPVLAMTETDLDRLGLSELAQLVQLRDGINKCRELRKTAAKCDRSAVTPATDGGLASWRCAAVVSPPPVIDGAPVAISDVFGRAFQSLFEEYQVDASRIQLNKLIGRGEYGVVYKGVYDNPHTGVKEVVAVKTLSISHAEDRSIEIFIQEIIKMKPFKHKNIMELKGITFHQSNPCCIMPFMDQGDLKTYISDQEKKFYLDDLLRLALGVAEGMKYLEDHNFVHGDLAARNCLLDSSGTVKVSDFGLSRQLFLSDYFNFDKSRNQPLRWLAIEALTDCKNTRESDRWSYGIMLMELMTRGEKPYPDIRSNHVLIQKLREGYRMPCPEHVDIVVYSLMEACWNSDRTLRPSFKDICDKIKGWFNAQSNIRRSHSAREATTTRHVVKDVGSWTIRRALRSPDDGYLTPRNFPGGRMATPAWDDTRPAEGPTDTRVAFTNLRLQIPPVPPPAITRPHSPPVRPPPVPRRRQPHNSLENELDD